MSEINITSIVVPYLITSFLGIVLGWLGSNFKKNKQKEDAKEKENEALKAGVLALLRNEILRRYREFMSKGALTILDKENLEEMYEQYKNLGGNGMVKELMSELMQLPTKIIKE